MSRRKRKERSHAKRKEKKIREENESKTVENDMINHSATAIIVFTFPNERKEKCSSCFRERTSFSTYLHLVVDAGMPGRQNV